MRSSECLDFFKAASRAQEFGNRPLRRAIPFFSHAMTCRASWAQVLRPRTCFRAWRLVRGTDNGQCIGFARNYAANTLRFAAPNKVSSPIPNNEKLEGSGADCTFTLSIAKSSAVEVSDTELNVAPLKVINPSGRV
jgi:hypothetical protein